MTEFYKFHNYFKVKYLGKSYQLKIVEEDCVLDVVMGRNTKQDRLLLFIDFDLFVKITSVLIYIQSEVLRLKINFIRVK